MFFLVEDAFNGFDARRDGIVAEIRGLRWEFYAG
jgi:hypothetical protein